MKKLLTLTLAAASIAFAAPLVEAKAAESSNLSPISVAANAAQTTVQIRRGRRGYRRVVTGTRNVRVGGRLYRETYQTRYLPNGRVTTRIISRVRLR